MDKIKILDTTLRDGEQAPGYSMHLSEKLEIAAQLARLKVDVIEAGFAASGEADSEAIRRIAKEIKGVTVCSLARANEHDIDAAYEAVKDAESPRIHVFIATSPIHIKYKLKLTEDEVLERIRYAVRYAKEKLSDVQFSAEDAMRSDPEFLIKAIGEAIAAGATTVNLPDTVGYCMPFELRDTFKRITDTFSGKNVTFATHCHDDLGMSVSNSLAAVLGGARQIECTVNGIGERAGNTPLEEVVMAIKTRAALFNADTGIDCREIYNTSRLVSSVTGVKIPPSKAIVGRNAFRHESGIHQHGVMMNRETYEIMSPSDVGIKENDIVLGKHSGRHAFQNYLNEKGYKFAKDVIESLFAKFKDLASKKKVVTDKDLESLIFNTNKNGVKKLYSYRSYSLATIGGITEVKLTLLSPDGEKVAEGKGDGPVDAAFKAINTLLGLNLKLEDYNVSAVTEGEDAQGVATLRLSLGDVTMTGRGVSTDVVEASILAYVNGANKLLEE